MGTTTDASSARCRTAHRRHLLPQALSLCFQLAKPGSRFGQAELRAQFAASSAAIARVAHPPIKARFLDARAFGRSVLDHPLFTTARDLHDASASDVYRVRRTWSATGWCTAPRVIGGREWARITRGLAQLLAALNWLIDDLYHDQDRSNPSSLLGALTAARENLRRTRILLPSGCWAHVQPGLPADRHARRRRGAGQAGRGPGASRGGERAARRTGTRRASHLGLVLAPDRARRSKHGNQRSTEWERHM